MGTTEDQLMPRLRRGYELGRLRASVRDTWVVLPIYAIAMLHHRATAYVVVGCVALALLGTVLSWRGRSLRGAWWAGLLAGVIPLVLPSLVPGTCVFELGGFCLSGCLASCPLAGGVAGALIGILAARQDGPRVTFLAVAGAVAALTGTVGCALAGLLGVAGMLAGTVLATVPTYLSLARPRAI